MEPLFWHERWQKGDIGFHRDTPHTALARHWNDLGLSAPATVFVPLCGKSLDMAWLAGEGHTVRGVELSQLAIDAFFEERKLSPISCRKGDFHVSSAGPYELWCGDLFALPDEALADIGAVYDRASLVALPPAMQETYADWLSTSIPNPPIMLISLAYHEAEMTGPPFSIPESRVRTLLGRNFELEILSDDDVIEANVGLKKRGLTALRETVYLARRRT